ncbi:MAG: hypothetical protein LM590_11185 [Thermofilum sp.]|nr:hypothetical protein [Thermofilum sp.]
MRLLPTPKQKEMLHYIGDQGARLMNMEDYRRRQLFFVGGGIDTDMRLAREITKVALEYQEIKKVLGAKNFDKTLRRVSEAWKSFAELLKERGEGRLPPWLKPRPPGYRKRSGERLPIIN